MKKGIVIVAGIGILSLLGGHSAYAAISSSCDLRDDASRLIAIQEGKEPALSELDVRKSTLTHVLQCAETDTISLKQKLEGLSLADTDTINLKSQFTIKITQALVYYKNQNEKIGSLGIRGTRELAQEISLWRAQDYDPQSEAIENFIIWNNNQDLFKKAEDRLAQIRNTVNSFKIIDGVNDIQTIFHEAAQMFQKAKDLNALAKSAIITYPLVTDTSTPLKTSLETLAAVYQKFFDLSKAITKIIPH